MNKNNLKIGICHWDGYETLNKKCELVKGSKITKEEFGLTTIKIYAGNKYSDTYDDLKQVNNINSLKDLLTSEPYTKVFKMGFKCIVIVAFSINNSRNDDYWRENGPDNNEYSQFKEVSEYLNTYTNTEFILSNWESDCVIESYSSNNKRKIIADNIKKLINVRYKSVLDTNVKVALEVNRFYSDKIGSIEYIIPNVNCHMISYSCYQTLWDSNEKLINGIKHIKKYMKPGVELYIGEFGYSINNMKKDSVLKSLKDSIETFNKHNIRLAFYWNLYCNEKKNDNSFNGFGLIDIEGNKTYVCKTLFNSQVYFIRHGISLANEWKHTNKKDYINLNTALFHNLYDADLSHEGIKLIRNKRNELWTEVLRHNKTIRIFISPLKRSINTFLETIKDNNYLSTSFLKNIKVSITPLITEIGDSKENFGSSLESLKVYPPLLELKNIVKEINFIHFPKNNIKWWGVSKNDFLNKKNVFLDYLSNRTKNECIICFTHWGFTNYCFNVSLSNFGKGNYSYYINI